MHTIDLRSDTVTLPTKEMREAISNAELGDDVFQEDPTINNLEKLAAKKFNKEAAIFLPSGTMANLVAVLTHCNRGDEVILGDQSHTFLYEAGGISSFGGVHSRQLKNHNDGTIHLNDIKNAIRKKDVHFPPSRLICLENTHNRCFGMPLETNYVNEVVDIAKNNDMYVHVDGARIFNAAVATGSTVADLTKNVDSVSFCLSKGLKIDVITFCPHHPHQGFDKEIYLLKKDCFCRKPNPGLFQEQAFLRNIDLNQSLMIGDSEIDRLASKNAGCNFINVDSL